MECQQERRPEVVVGFDASPAGQAALEWASSYARHRGIRLRAIHVLTPGSHQRVLWSPVVAPTPLDLPSDAPGRAIADVGELFGRIEPPPDWTLEFRTGAVGSILVEQARAADLLVIGTREHTGVERLFRGSISHYCLSRSRCPVVAVASPEAVVERRGNRRIPLASRPVPG